MPDATLPTLVLVFAIAALSPVLADLPRRIRVPGVVLELALGILVGPHLLGWAERSEPIDLLAEFGLAFLIFLAGFEIDVQAVRGVPITLASASWALSLVLGLVAGIAAESAGFALSAVVIGLALSTTALGTLLPIVRDAGLARTPFGTDVLAGGAVGEFGPIVAIALILTGDSPTHSAVTLTAFAVIAGTGIWLSSRPVPPRLDRLMSHTLHTSGQLVVRICVVAIAGLVWWAAELGLDILLGAFAAGVIARLLVHSAHDHREVELVESKLEAIGFGFLVPLFFVVSGMKFDLEALTSSVSTLARLPLFLVLFLVVRGLPVLLLYRHQYALRVRVALAVITSAALPLVVVITEIGVRTDRMKPANAAALVGAGMLSVLIFPLVALALKQRGEPAVEPDSASAPAPA